MWHWRSQKHTEMYSRILRKRNGAYSAGCNPYTLLRCSWMLLTQAYAGSHILATTFGVKVSIERMAQWVGLIEEQAKDFPVPAT